MLTLPERVLFLLLVMLSSAFVYRGFRQMKKIISRGEGQLCCDCFGSRLVATALVYVSQCTVLKRRFLTHVFHLGIVWRFTVYFAVNLGDVLEGYFPAYKFLGQGYSADFYRLIADLLSVTVLVAPLSALR